MEEEGTEFSMGEFQLLGKTPIPVEHLAVILLLTAIPVFLYFSPYNKYAVSLWTSGDYGNASSKTVDLFNGEWVPDPAAPYYTNWTCDTIHEFSCRKVGRPDDGYMKWRWRPYDGELPPFDPSEFLEMMRGKSMAFIGDSLARNHFDSLVCLLSKVARPVVEPEKFGKKIFMYEDYAFNVTVIWSVYLVHAEATVIEDYSHPFNVFLDEFDLLWTTRVADFDYIILSASRWFTRPSYLYINRTLVGCLLCKEDHRNVSHLPVSSAISRAFRTAFRAISGAENFTGVTFMRTVSPPHYEGGAWNMGGDCPRTEPVKREEMLRLEDYVEEMHKVQLEELGVAQRAAAGRGKFRLLDVTKAMALRPDGHPSHYGRTQGANDCVHWCLPGPIDTWNSLLQELKRTSLSKLSFLRAV